MTIKNNLEILKDGVEGACSFAAWVAHPGHSVPLLLVSLAAAKGCVMLKEASFSHERPSDPDNIPGIVEKSDVVEVQIEKKTDK